MEYLQFEFKDLTDDSIEILSAELSILDHFEGINFEENAMLVCYTKNETSLQEVASIANQYNVTYTHKFVQQQNWNAIWESSFEPIVIDEYCYIRASFHPEASNAFKHEIVITPKMSFGTGHHATTQLVIRLMSTIDFNNKNVFDFGTGTGILAILASKLGANNVLANDVDDWCIENTEENCKQNAIQNVSATLESIETLNVNQQFDIILANINRHILLSYMQHMYTMLQFNGDLILSGILLEDVSMIDAAAESVGFQKVKALDQANWVVIHYTK